MILIYKYASAAAKNAYKGKSKPLFKNPTTGNCFLPVCTLHIQEVMAPDGYEKDSTVIPIDVVAPAKDTDVDTWTSVVARLTNANYIALNDENKDKWRVQAQAYKVDENGNPLAGALFGFYRTEANAKAKENSIAKLKTKADGYTDTYKSESLNENVSSYTLYCREIAAPPGYALSDTIYTKTFSKASYDALKAKDANTPGELQTFGDKTGIVNKKTGWNYSMQVKKVDDKGKPLAGAVFSIYASKGDAETDTNALFELTTGKDGLTPVKTLKAAFSVPSITYYCKETQAPEGYQIGSPNSSGNEDDSSSGGAEIYEQTWTYDEYKAFR